MVFELVSPILGFENVNFLEFNKIDDCFSNISSKEGYTWTLVNPFLLRSYSFEIPHYARILLDIKDGSEIEVYCVVVLQNPLEDSKVHFLAPIILNHTNKKAIQLVLSPYSYPEFAKLESLKSFAK